VYFYSLENTEEIYEGRFQELFSIYCCMHKYGSIKLQRCSCLLTLNFGMQSLMTIVAILFRSAGEMHVAQTLYSKSSGAELHLFCLL